MDQETAFENPTVTGSKTQKTNTSTTLPTMDDMSFPSSGSGFDSRQPYNFGLVVDGRELVVENREEDHQEKHQSGILREALSWLGETRPAKLTTDLKIVSS